MEKRLESDSMGQIEVPNNRLWGAQTERSIENFRVGREKLPMETIYAHALVKKACAIVNAEMDLLSNEKRDLIVDAAEKIYSGELDTHFPLSLWQTGSGTQTNMNVNEVISNYACQKVGGTLGSKKPIHPNDDANKSQSSNDTFPTSMHVSAVCAIQNHLLPNLQILHAALSDKAQQFFEIVKIGRTHLMDATPLTLGQEFSGFKTQVAHGIEAVQNALPHLLQLSLGGTAVGTGLNSPPNFGARVAEVLRELTGHPFVTSPNKFEALGTLDSIVELSGALKRIACSFMKIANDIRLLASGPRCGIGEIIIPSNEPGSSIMPGKVNPTQCESMTMVAAQVIGNDAAIAVGGMNGHLQLNVFRPMMIYTTLESIHLLADSAKNFTEKCLVGIEAHTETIERFLGNSLMLVTALNPVIGYDNAAKIAKKAFKEGITLKDAALALKLLTAEEFDKAIVPRKMVNID